MERREFLKKAGLGLTGVGILALGEKLFVGDQLGIRSPFETSKKTHRFDDYVYLVGKGKLTPIEDLSSESTDDLLSVFDMIWDQYKEAGVFESHEQKEASHFFISFASPPMPSGNDGIYRWRWYQLSKDKTDTARRVIISAYQGEKEAKLLSTMVVDISGDEEIYSFLDSGTDNNAPLFANFDANIGKAMIQDYNYFLDFAHDYLDSKK